MQRLCFLDVIIATPESCVFIFSLFCFLPRLRRGWGHITTQKHASEDPDSSLTGCLTVQGHYVSTVAQLNTALRSPSLLGGAGMSAGRMDTFTGVGCVENAGTRHAASVLFSLRAPRPMQISRTREESSTAGTSGIRQHGVTDVWVGKCAVARSPAGHSPSNAALTSPIFALRSVAISTFTR